MRNQSVERHTGLRIEVSTEEEFPWRAIAAVELELVRPIVWQTSVSVIEQALKVEQRSDVRVRLAVVITEEAFVVTDQAREHVRRDELEVIRKSLRGGELDSTIEALCATKALWSVARTTRASRFFSGARAETARVEDEVGVAIVERTVFDDVDHGTINPAAAENDVVADFILATEREFADALGLQTRIGRSCIRAQVSGSSADARNDQ